MLIVGLVFSFFIFTNYSDGDRAGTIIKLSRKGYLFKTYEGELNLGMVYVEGSETSVNKTIWEFSVKNDQQLIDSIQYAMLNAKRAKLHYQEKYYVFPWVGESKYVVDKIEIEH
jgi:hypothetical protein